MPAPHIGQPRSRVDGHLKVTGQARYAAEHAVPECVHGVLVTSAIATGRITHLDTTAAAQLPGVLAIVSHLNSPKVPGYENPQPDERVEGQQFRVFFDDKIYYSNQPVALAIASTLEQAQYAASLVRVAYEHTAPQTDIAKGLAHSYKPKKEKDHLRGQPQAYKTAPVQIAHEYQTPLQVHNPMEMHAAIAQWQGNQLTVWNKTQAPSLAQKDLMKLWALPKESVQVHSPFVGGAFGGASRIWPPEMAAILGAKVVGRPVKVVNAREQEFNMVGYRPRSVQRVALGAQADGTLVGVSHEAFGMTSRYEQFTERILHPTKSGYRCPNAELTYHLVPLDMSTPAWTRGPGETTGSFAIESAMDELAYALKMDPLALRLKNFAETDPENDKPWSSNYLRECYAQGAEKFNWSQRNPTPGATRDGDWLVGQGMAMGIYHASRAKASARARLLPDGTLVVQSATADVGPGTATVMTQIAADASGVAPENIRFELGDAAFPEAPGQFGSHTVASVGAAVHDTCAALRQQLINLAFSMPGSPFAHAKLIDLVAEGGSVRLASHPATSRAYGDVLRQAGQPALEVMHESPEVPEKGEKSGKSFCASFVEVRVHVHTREVRVSRVVSAIDAGRIMNHKTARSQVYGAITWGLGLALMEDAVLDHRFGRITNHDLANYHVPVNADIPTAIDVIFIDKPDDYLDPIGAKGLGEIGIVGFSAAIANAVYHATGKRVRDLPITPDKLL
ncbi:xanthine dehydrogenase family protein molybdopterin-binding subunit [Hymenobacter ginsengisoli]|uniref:Xanthine dehydrogenase family protein molybdopterin-binding subunit n=1 Tax=Hymenobacter ginsengisoli TaxID=1051626 RepID=A0ABP8Q6E0_9BACT|nr:MULTISPECIES: xanthine dehydrogenase family protein molybdopterin-binding subunit [unclassified Hymenobacter]MBO2030971.1 xanthine dehydrogenase family protein molybdopterin-binding subunit [Hymenobacter sp. BT559]